MKEKEIRNMLDKAGLSSDELETVAKAISAAKTEEEVERIINSAKGLHDPGILTQNIWKKMSRSKTTTSKKAAAAIPAPISTTPTPASTATASSAAGGTPPPAPTPTRTRTTMPPTRTTGGNPPPSGPTTPPTRTAATTPPTTPAATTGGTPPPSGPTTPPTRTAATPPPPAPTSTRTGWLISAGGILAALVFSGIALWFALQADDSADDAMAKADAVQTDADGNTDQVKDLDKRLTVLDDTTPNGNNIPKGLALKNEAYINILNTDLSNVEDRVNGHDDRITGLEGRADDADRWAMSTDQRITVVEERADTVEGRVDKLEKGEKRQKRRVAKVEDRLTRLESEHAPGPPPPTPDGPADGSAQAEDSSIPHRDEMGPVKSQGGKVKVTITRPRRGR